MLSIPVRIISLVACTLGVLGPSLSERADAKIIVTSADAFRIGNGQSGSQTLPALAPYGGNGSIATWLSPGGASQHAYVGWFSIFGDQRTVLQIGSASGPTAGLGALSAAPVEFADTTSMVLFAANPRTGAASTKQDVFGQRLSAFNEKVGLPFRVNQSLPAVQTQILAARLAGGNVLATWLTHATAASSFNLRGRVLKPNGVAVANEQAIAADTSGAQTATGLAPLTNGNAVLAYFVRTGTGASARQIAYLQRLGPTGAMIGKPVAVKQTTGANTYGGVAVAALPQGRFMALWWVPGTGGRVNLKRQVFQANGTGGPIATVTTGAIKPASQNAPKVILSEDGVMVVVDQFGAGTYQIGAVLLDATGTVITAPHVIATSKNALVTTALTYDSESNGYDVSWTQTSSGGVVKAFARGFYVTAGCTSKC